MPGSLNNRASADAYSAANTLEVAPPASKVNMVIANAAVYVQFSDAAANSTMRQTQSWLPEIFYLPGYYNLNRPTGPNRAVNGVRFRSAVAGTPAQVTVSAI